MACLFSVLLMAETPSEMTVKAAFVFNLTKYVEWPQRDTDMMVCVIGDSSTASTLRQMLDGKTAGMQTLRVVAKSPADSLQDCQILYVSSSSPAKYAGILSRVSQKPVLTVGETSTFAQQGGVVGLVNAGNHIRIEINPEAARAATLKISARLLNLAILVHSAE
jgi:hypothetical protein